MHHKDRARKTKTLLADADLAFDSGRFREGAGMMWEAARLSIVAVADANGWPSETLDDLKRVIYRLDDRDEEGRLTKFPTHWAAFGVANSYREQAETNDEDWPSPEFRWIDLEYTMHQKSVKMFIAHMESRLKSERTSI